ncbi:hypothetical protein Tco_0150342 [Tanacetum coccineum]
MAEIGCNWARIGPSKSSLFWQLHEVGCPSDGLEDCFHSILQFGAGLTAVASVLTNDFGAFLRFGLICTVFSIPCSVLSFWLGPELSIYLLAVKCLDLGDREEYCLEEYRSCLGAMLLISMDKLKMFRDIPLRSARGGVSNLKNVFTSRGGIWLCRDISLGRRIWSRPAASQRRLWVFLSRTSVVGTGISFSVEPRGSGISTKKQKNSKPKMTKTGGMEWKKTVQNKSQRFKNAKKSEESQLLKKEIRSCSNGAGYGRILLDDANLNPSDGPGKPNSYIYEMGGWVGFRQPVPGPAPLPPKSSTPWRPTGSLAPIPIAFGTASAIRHWHHQP